MKFWIIVDNHHDGPHTAEDLVKNGLTPDTLVWCEGLADWTKARNVPELMDALGRSNAESGEAQQAENYVASDAANPASEVANEPMREAARAAFTANRTTLTAQPSPAFWNQPQPAAGASSAEEQPYAPMVWSIIVTLCCCLPIGVVGIVMSSLTKTAYYRGYYTKAKRYSEIAQWSIIIGITLGVMAMPFQMAMMGAGF